MSQQNEVLMSHNYDGIEEYDNPLPAWWLITFLITIQFGFLYWIHYEFGRAPTQLQELQADLSEIKQMKHNQPAPADKEEDLAALVAQPAALEKGQQVFVARCVACHGQELQGTVGPNLVDDYWIHGQGKLVDIATVVRTGVLDKGMPPWGEVLTHDEVKNVTAFVFSKQGSNPKDAKPPQGNKIGKNK